MLVTIQLETSNDGDRQILSTIFGPRVVTATPEPVVAAPQAPTPKAEAPAKPKAAPKPAPKAEEPPAPAPEPEEDLIGGDDPAALREQATNVATELVTTGQSAKVREALTALGAKRVGGLKDDQLEAFLAAVA